MMHLEIDVRDSATPEIQRMMKSNPRIAAQAIRKTAARHRRLLVKYTRNGGGTTNKLKKGLYPHVEAAVAARNTASKDKHIHGTDLPFHGRFVHTTPFYQTMRYVKADPTGLAYRFGFTSDETMSRFGGGSNKTSRFTRGAEKYALLQAEGNYMDKSSGRIGKEVTASMRRYFGAVGIGLKASTKFLKIPERKPVEDYMKTNRLTILRDYEQEFHVLFEKNRRYNEVRRAQYVSRGRK